MTGPELDDADERYLERVADDAEQLLGGGISLLDVTVSRHETTVIRARYALGSLVTTTEGRGDNLIEAHVDLRNQLVIDRIRIAATALIDRGAQHK